MQSTTIVHCCNIYASGHAIQHITEQEFTFFFPSLMCLTSWSVCLIHSSSLLSASVFPCVLTFTCQSNPSLLVRSPRLCRLLSVCFFEFSCLFCVFVSSARVSDISSCLARCWSVPPWILQRGVSANCTLCLCFDLILFELCPGYVIFLLFVLCRLVCSLRSYLD